MFRKAIAVVGLVSGLCHGAAVERSLGDVQSGLKRVTPAAVACKPDQLSAATADAAPVPTPDLSCALSASAARQRLSAASTYVVDVRGKDAFDAFHIAAAINLSAAELTRKDYLKSRDLLLVGGGRGESALYEACRRLREDGFQSVSVIRGGMPAWVFEGGEVSGVAPAMAPSRQLAAPDLVKEAGFSGNLFVFWPEQSKLSKHFKGREQLALITKQKIAEAVARKAALKKGSLVAIVLAAPPDAAVYAQAADIQKKTGLPVLVYVDGIGAYEAALQQQKTILASSARPPKPQKCSL